MTNGTEEQIAEDSISTTDTIPDALSFTQTESTTIEINPPDTLHAFITLCNAILVDDRWNGADYTAIRICFPPNCSQSKRLLKRLVTGGHLFLKYAHITHACDVGGVLDEQINVIHEITAIDDDNQHIELKIHDAKASGRAKGGGSFMVTDAYSNAKSFRRLHQAVVSKEEEAIAILEPSMTCHRAVQSCLEEHLLMLKAIPSTNGRATWIHNHGEKEGWWKKKAITSTKQQLISSLGRELRNHKEKLPLPENNRGRRSKSKHSRQ